MCNVEKNEFFEFTNNTVNSLEFMNKLVGKIEKHSDKDIESVQCIESLRDNIDILKKQIEEIKERFTLFHMNMHMSNTKLFTEAFTMKDTKVLIVDDNEINNYVLEQMLKRFDIDVDIAKSGEEAIDKFMVNEYDLILMDYLLPPGIDGIETVRRIRNLSERGKNQFIIGLTANTMEEFKKGLNENNVELILLKPIKFQQMAVILQKELPDKVVR
ncbi:MAG: response regulator [Lachnospiraceae bacterium]|nr:response regulator [Clostridiales bacterium]MDD6294103.1 response regulator [Eubacteriales bacterium]MDY2606737.1 response regulator [Lachnospiraceae bacterium]